MKLVSPITRLEGGREGGRGGREGGEGRGGGGEGGRERENEGET